MTSDPATVARLHVMIDRYTGAVYDAGDSALGPWPDDPDGGLLRIVHALRGVLDQLPADALADVAAAFDWTDLDRA